MTGKLLVTGASGQLGSLVIRHLLETNKVPTSAIVAGSRDTSKLSGLASQGVETRKVDFDDAASLKEGFAGVDRVLLKMPSKDRDTCLKTLDSYMPLLA